MALTVRLNPKTERALAALARRRQMSRSEIVREAIERYEAADNSGDDREPYSAWLDVIGVVKLGARDAARTTGAQFAAMLQERARARHSR